MNDYTPAQRGAIKNWTAERDALSREISVNSTILSDQKKELTDNGLALADLHKQIEFAKGRLAELDALEERHKNSVSIEINTLEVTKTRLQSEVTAEELKLAAIEEKKAIHVGDINVIFTAHQKMSDQITIVEKIVGTVVENSNIHLSESKTLMDSIRTIATEVIEKGNKNIETANIVIPKMTQFVIDLQRPIPVRRIPDRQVFRKINSGDDLKTP